MPVSAGPAGSAFWLILPEDMYITNDVPLETQPQFDGSKGYQIQLYSGWNMFGNPYEHEVPWQAALFTYHGQTKSLLDAESAGWVRSIIYGYNGSVYQSVTSRSMLEPYQGYWIVALVGGIDQTDCSHDDDLAIDRHISPCPHCLRRFGKHQTVSRPMSRVKLRPVQNDERREND